MQIQVPYLVMGDINLLDVGEFAQLVQGDVILWAVKVDKVSEVLQVIGVDFDDAFVGDVGGDDLFGVFNVEEFQ